MPGIDEKKPEIAGAICAPPTPNNIQVVLNQPRQPTNLQGLLKFCMEATQSEDAPHDESRIMPLDEEKKKWLEQALKSMTIDLIQLLTKQIEILHEVKNIQPDEDDISKFTTAIETILEQIDHIDVACDFHKIGGFTILNPCLECKHPKIRSMSCEMIAELCQNNPYCQEVILDNEFLQKLLHLLEHDTDISVKIKSLYAISAIIRQNQNGFEQFIQYNGPAILLKALKQEDDKLIIKATFLLKSLTDSQPDFKNRLVFLEYIPVLIELIVKERQPSHEHILSLLANLIEDNSTGIGECRTPKYNLNQILQKYIEDYKNKSECLEEIQHCKRILYLAFGVNE